jgi:hypothetical protein
MESMMAEERGPLDELKFWIAEKEARSMSYPHYQVHQAKSYAAGFIVTGTADNQQVNLFLFNPLGAGNKVAHLTMEGIVGGRGYLYRYEGTTISNSGTQLSVAHLNRTIAPDNEWKALQNVAVSSFGTALPPRFIPGSAATNPNAARVSGETRPALEWNLEPLYGYLYVLLNASGATVPTELYANWYEHSFITPV